jgi:DNA-binding NtrC family response regulator
MSGNGKEHLHASPFSPPRGRALLLDENEKDLKYFTTLLERMAYSVRPITKYQEAEGCVEHEPFDFIIVSPGSPAFAAHRLVEHTLARHQHTPVVVLTRCLEMNCLFAAKLLGTADYLEKDLTPAEFEHLVTEHCRPSQGAMPGRAS